MALSSTASTRTPCRREGSGGIALDDLGLGQPEPGGKVELASPADFALDPDAALHQAGQPRGDGQPQARPAVTAGHGVVGLLEHLEDRRAPLFGDAHSRVADHEVQRATSWPRPGGRAAVSRRGLQTDLEDHFALLGELDGVADQVDHDLAKAAVVADDHPRDVGMDEAGQFQALRGGGDGERFHRVAQAFPQVEGLALQHQFSGLDPGEVEDVVDHGEQGFPGIPAPSPGIPAAGA